MGKNMSIKTDVETIDKLIKHHDTPTMMHEFDAWERIKKYLNKDTCSGCSNEKICEEPEFPCYNNRIIYKKV